MKTFAAPVVLVIAALHALPSVGRVMDEHPAVKVIGMLKNLDGQVKSEHEAEELNYAKFETWCGVSMRTLKKAVDTEKEEIDVLQNKIDSKTKLSSKLEKEISQLEEEIAKHEASKEEATKTREEAATLYATTDSELAETIQAISEALDSLQSAETTTAFVQAKISHLVGFPSLLAELSDSQREELLAATTEDPSGEEILAKGDAAAHQRKYTFKSGNVIELLKELKRKFEDDRIEATKGETNSQNAHELMKSDLENALANAAESKTAKETAHGDAKTALTEAETSLSAVEADLEADSATLESTTSSCRQKKEEWTERTEMREKERKAIAAAIGILEKVTGVRTEAPTNPQLPKSPVSFVVQTHSVIRSFLDDPKTRAINLLREEALKVHSKSFARFAEDVAAQASGPFDEVNSMIQKMIFRLMAEQKDEDDHKNWCDLELGKSNASKVEKETKIAEFEARLEDMKAKVTLLTEEIAETDEMIAEIAKHMKEATEIRQTGKAENKNAIEDAKAAQQALAQATAVIQEFYKESGKVPEQSFVQRGVDLPEEPSTWGSSYTGVADPEEQPDGIVTVLKTVSADFAKMEADTAAQEVMDQKAYQEDMKECEIEKSRRGKESEMKSEEKKRVLDKISSTQKSLKTTSGQLYAVEQYLKDLSPACVEGDSTYEERKDARDREISALKEAQVILASAQEGSTEKKPATAFLSPVKRVSL